MQLFFTHGKNCQVNTPGNTLVLDGKQADVSATIVPGAIYGLPITADQDKFYALMKIVNDRIRSGVVGNPIAFTSAEILRLLGKYRDSGKNYKEIIDWLDVMTSTTIISEGAVYTAGKKRWVRDRFHVFDRAVAFGREIEDGLIADKNYVWFSEWQWENIRSNYLLPIDFETYKQFKNHIAKALIPLLQVWLYASRNQRFFEIGYAKLCQILNVRQYRHLSDIKRKFGPSLDELKGHGYLADWRIERTADRRGFKMILSHGDKFFRDRGKRIYRIEKPPVGINAGQSTLLSKTEQGTEQPLLAELVSRGVTEDRARQLLQNRAVGQEVLDQLEWGDVIIAQKADKIYNPAGLYISLIKNNVPPPPNFETSRRRRLGEEQMQSRRHAQEEQARLEIAYRSYCSEELERHIRENYPVEVTARLIEARKAEIKSHHWLKSASDELITRLARKAVRHDIAKEITLLDFDSFCKQFSENTSATTPKKETPPMGGEEGREHVSLPS